MKKRTIFLIAVFLFIILGAFGVIQWQLPKVEAFAKYYIKNLSKDDAVPVIIEFESLNAHIFPIGLSLSNTTITPKKKLSTKLKPLKVAHIEVRPSLLDLLIGKFWISQLLIDGTEVDISIVDEQDKPAGEAQKIKLPKIEFRKILPKIPISEITLKSFKLTLNYHNQLLIKTESLYLRALNQKSSLLAKVKDPHISITNLANNKTFDALIDAQFMLTRTTLSVSKLKLVKDDAYIIGSGSLRHADSFRRLVEARFSTRIKSEIAQVNEWVNIFKKTDDLDILNGKFKFDFEIEKSVGREMQYRFRADVDDFVVDDIKLGKVDVVAKATGTNKITIPRAQINLPGKENIIFLSGGKVLIDSDKTVKFNVDLNVKKFQIKSFLRDSGITDIPVWLRTAGKLSCEGAYKKFLRIACPGKLTVEDVKIQTSGKKTIVEVAKADIDATAVITEKNISYKGHIYTKDSAGQSEGVIDYKKGFDIKFSTPKLDLANVGHVADLPLAGITSVSGSTKGNADSAVFNMDLKAENFEFTDYYFGNTDIKLNYKKGTIYFTEIQGALESTRYKGNLEVDLLEERIRGQFGLPFFRMQDVQQAVIKKVDLQERFSGSGSGQIKVDTSFDTEKLSFGVQARLFKGTAFGEEFDEAQLNAISNEGIISVKRATLIKEQTKLDLSGTLTMNLDTDFKFVISKGDLNNSRLLRELDAPLAGTFSANGKVVGKLDAPVITVSANINNFSFNRYQYGTAKFIYEDKGDHSRITFAVERKLYLRVRLPKVADQDYAFDLEAESVDIAPIIGYAIAEGSTQSYVINVNGEASGKVNPKNLWGSEFSSTIRKMVIAYKGNRLESQLPLNAELKNTRLFMNELKFEGENQFLSVEQSHTAPFVSHFLINGRINISFFKLFAPFIERIDGTSTLRLELDLKKEKVKLIGSSYTSDAYIQFPQFPHPFENVTADVLFNQNKVLINSITGRLAGGKVFGNGEFLVLGPKKYDLKVNMDMQKINLNFPEDFSTVGDAQVTFEGSGIPFKLSGKYDIEGGLVEKELEGTTDTSIGSNLLPQLLEKREASPIILDIDINANEGVDVRNSMMEGKVYGAIRVFDKIESPKLKGEVNFDRFSRLKFRDAEFQITDSKFQFRGLTPMNPALFMTAKTRLQSYDINMLLQGTAKNPKIGLTSQPPLSEQKIISLLAFGQVTDDLETEITNPTNPDDPQNNNQNSSLQIGGALLNRNPLGREIKERLGVDIEFSSSIDNTSSLAVPRITLKKKLDEKIEASVSRQEGQQAQTEIRLRYELNEDLSTVLRARRQEFQGGNDNTPLLPQNDNVLGVDLEYKVEFK